MVFRPRLVAFAVIGALTAVPVLADLAPGSSGTLARGRSLYEANCALCHGKDGAPLPAFAKKNAPDFRSAAWQKSRTDQQIRKSIVEGVPSTMMRGFGKTVSDIGLVVIYVRSLGAKTGAK